MLDGIDPCEDNQGILPYSDNYYSRIYYSHIYQENYAYEYDRDPNQQTLHKKCLNGEDLFQQNQPENCDYSSDDSSCTESNLLNNNQKICISDTNPDQNQTINLENNIDFEDLNPPPQ